MRNNGNAIFEIPTYTQATLFAVHLRPLHLIYGKPRN